MRFAGRLALVTGGAGGIGRGIAGALAAEGARVVTVDREPSATVVADLAEADAGALAGKLLEEHGTFDLVVNNVGTTTPDRFLDLEEADWDAILRVNLRTPWFLTRELAAALVAERRRGAVLFISSLHDHVPHGYPHYSASKAAVAMLVRELAHELGPHGIRVNALSPGFVDTRGGLDDSGRRLEQLIPLGRAGRPEDVAPVALALLDDAVCGYVTGANLPVDGGLDTFTWLDVLD